MDSNGVKGLQERLLALNKRLRTVDELTMCLIVVARAISVEMDHAVVSVWRLSASGSSFLRLVSTDVDRVPCRIKADRDTDWMKSLRRELVIDPQTASWAGAVPDPLTSVVPLVNGAELHGFLAIEGVEPSVDMSIFLMMVAEKTTTLLITDQRRDAQIRLEEKEESYRSLVEDQSEFIVRARPDGRLLFANRALCAHLQLPLKELRNRHITDFVPDDERHVITEQLAHLSPSNPMVQYRHRTRNAQGGTTMVQWRLRAFYNDRATLLRYQAIGMDVTSDLMRDAKANERQRLETLAIVAGGVAHDMNNILTPIAAYADLALETLPPDAPERAHLTQVIQAAARGQDLARRALVFGRRADASERRPITPAAFVEESLSYVRATARPSITFDVHLDRTLTISADPSDLYQIVANLVGNAVSVLPDGGNIEVRLEVGGPEEVELIVSDNGPGIPPNVLPHIFEPFFTTRSGVGGNGLGLSIVQSVVHELGGRIRVDSELDVGTTFHITLPLLAPAKELALLERPALADASVLVVDDEASIGEFIRVVLQSSGYEVTLANGPEAGLDALQSTGFDLLITDLTMPTMSGLTFTEHARRLQPGLPVVITTGFAHLLTQQELQAVGARRMLSKPFTMKQLAATVHQALCTEDPEPQELY